MLGGAFSQFNQLTPAIFSPAFAAQSLTSDEKSFASVTAHERWPVILVSFKLLLCNLCADCLIYSQTSAIDDLHRTVADITNTEKRQEGKGIIEQLAKLKYELQHNRPLT